jgi:heptosyltransferase-2
MKRMKSLPESPGKILIRSTNWIGDAIMTTPAVRTIRQNFPGSDITLLALPWVADVFAACPHIDHIFIYDKNGRHQGLRGKFRLAAELRAENYDLTILLQNAFEAALITSLACIPIRAGYTTDARGILLTHGVHKDPDIGSKHQVHYYQEMLRGLGLQPGPNSLELFLEPSAIKEAETLLEKAVQGRDVPIIGLNPGAAYGPAKRWPVRKYGELGRQLATATDGLILIFGTEEDQEAAAEIVAAIGDQVLDLTGKTSLAFALACIDRCHVFVTNDSGLMHAAAALDVNQVAVIGSTDYIATAPSNKNSIMVREPTSCAPCLKDECPIDHRCMTRISVDRVMETCRSVLG